MEHFIQTYGYIAVFVITLLQGESIMVAAGFAANRGFLALDLTILAGMAGTFVGDLLLFFAARAGIGILSPKRPSIARAIERIARFMDRHQSWFLLSYRFMYGIRTAVPIAMGVAKLEARKFIFLNLGGAFLWAAAASAAGYLIGSGLEAVLGDLKRHDRTILLGLILLILVVWLISIRRKKIWHQSDCGGENNAG